MISKVTALIDEYNMIEKHDLVAAGVSGGADSLCLLFMLLEYRKKVPFDLIVVHVNHGIREDANKDAECVKALCEKENLPFFSKRKTCGECRNRERQNKARSKEEDQEFRRGDIAPKSPVRRRAYGRNFRNRGGGREGFRFVPESDLPVPI